MADDAGGGGGDMGGGDSPISDQYSDAGDSGDSTGYGGNAESGFSEQGVYSQPDVEARADMKVDPGPVYQYEQGKGPNQVQQGQEAAEAWAARKQKESEFWETRWQALEKAGANFKRNQNPVFTQAPSTNELKDLAKSLGMDKAKGYEDKEDKPSPGGGGGGKAKPPVMHNQIPLAGNGPPAPTTILPVPSGGGGKPQLPSWFVAPQQGQTTRAFMQAEADLLRAFLPYAART